MADIVVKGVDQTTGRIRRVTAADVAVKTDLSAIEGLDQVTAGDGVDKTGDTIFAATSTATVEQQYGGLVNNRNSAGSGAAAADAGFLAVKTDNVDLAISTSNEVKIKSGSRLDHVRGSATYDGAAPVYADWNSLLPAVGNHGYLRPSGTGNNADTSSVFHAFRRSVASGTLADFGIVEMS